MKILTPLGGVAPYTHFTLEAPNLHRMMYEKKIHELTSHWLTKVEPGKATAYYLFRDGYKRNLGPKTGELPRRAGTDVVEVPFDTLVVCTARAPNATPYREIANRKAEWEKRETQAAHPAGDSRPHCTGRVRRASHRSGIRVLQPAACAALDP